MSLPSWICGRTSATGPKKKSMRPAITSVMASAPPLNGTWTASTPALRRNRSALRWVALPTPTEEKFSAPGFALAAATKSPTVFQPLVRRNNQDAGRDPEWDDRSKIPRRIEAEVGMERRRDGERGPVGEDRIAVGIRLGDEGGADCRRRRRRGSPRRCSGRAVAESCSNTTRGMMSVVLPAPTGTMARSGFVGQVSALASIVANPNPTTASNVKGSGFMTSSLSRVGSCREQSGIHAGALTQRGLAVQYLIPLAFYSDPA